MPKISTIGRSDCLQEFNGEDKERRERLKVYKNVQLEENSCQMQRELTLMLGVT